MSAYFVRGSLALLAEREFKQAALAATTWRSGPRNQAADAVVVIEQTLVKRGVIRLIFGHSRREHQAVVHHVPNQFGNGVAAGRPFAEVVAGAWLLQQLVGVLQVA